jgi:hypothetical protein
MAGLINILLGGGSVWRLSRQRQRQRQRSTRLQLRRPTRPPTPGVHSLHVLPEAPLWVDMAEEYISMDTEHTGA